MATGDGQPIIVDKWERKRIGDIFQIGDNGVSQDYGNELTPVIEACKTGTRTELLEKIKRFKSYTQRVINWKKISGIGPNDFLNERGREIVARLDRIATEIIDLSMVEDSQAIDVKHLLTLLEESNKLVYERAVILEQSFVGDTAINGIHIIVRWDDSADEYVFYLPQIDLELSRSQGVIDQIQRINADPAIAKKVFDYACEIAKSGESDVYSLYKRVEKFSENFT
ncbi:MAG: hypothetical protein WC884_00140 [Candidatus Paceibacterota bacterium]